MSSNREFAESFKKRTQFAVKMIEFCRTLPNSREANLISNQLIRCSTSVASNYRAACRARSGKEFYAKLCTVVEEADESVFWLEIISDTGINKSQTSQILLKEGIEILSIVSKARKTAGKNLN